MSERTLRTYGALLDEAKRTNVGVDELGSTLATSSAPDSTPTPPIGMGLVVGNTRMLAVVTGPPPCALNSF